MQPATAQDGGKAQAGQRSALQYGSSSADLTPCSFHDLQACTFGDEGHYFNDGRKQLTVLAINSNVWETTNRSINALNCK